MTPMTPKITRRGLFKIIAGFMPTVLVGRAPSPTAAPPTPTLRKVFLAAAYIAGFRYYDGMQAEVLAALRIGGELVLRRQLDNPHDPNAITIFTQDGHKLGYVPRIENLTPATIADQNVPLGADIVAVAPDAPPWERVRVHVYQQIADVPAAAGTQTPDQPPKRLAMPAAAGMPPPPAQPVDLNAAAEQRVRWYSQYVEEVDDGLRLTPPRGNRDVCSCCGYPTLETGICPLCWWTDDGEADLYEADHINCGANAGYSLTEARTNFHLRLTTRRPDDPHSRFDASPSVIAAKRGMIAAFDRMREVENDATVRGLWYAVYHAEDQLDALLEAKITQESPT